MSQTQPALRPGAAKPTLTERASAGLALVTLVATIAALLAGAVLNWTGTLLALAGVLIGVAAGWYAVSHRGTVRGIALVFLAVAVGLFGWGLLAGDYEALRVLAVVALALISVGCGRVALRRTRTEEHPHAHGHAAPRPRHPVLIMNLKSGGGKAVRFRLEDECRARGIEPVVLQPGDDLRQLAEDAIARGADVIGMAGGDGSQALVASVASRHGIPHVVIPAGTRNHFALDLGLDRDDVVGALDAYSDGVERRIDLAEVNGRVFVNNASMGVYARVVQSPEYRDAKMRTAAAMLPTIIGPDATPMDLRFTVPSGEELPTSQLILVSNNPYDLQDLRSAGTRVRIDGGTLGIVAVQVRGGADAERLVALESLGLAQRFPGWHQWKATMFEVRSAEPVDIGVDGEALTMQPPLRFRIRPG